MDDRNIIGKSIVTAKANQEKAKGSPNSSRSLHFAFCILHFSFLLLQWLCSSEFSATAIDEAILT